MSDEFGSRLSRWSQRKALARRGGALPEEAPSVAEPSVVQETALLPEAVTEQPAPDDTEPPLDLPPVEELTAESDFTVFLAKKVPEALQRAALRKLWTSDPVLACLDGLNDYDEDYAAAESLMEVVETTYRVGRGYLDDIEEKLDALGAGESEPEPAEQSGKASVSESDAERAANPLALQQDGGPADADADDKAAHDAAKG